MRSRLWWLGTFLLALSLGASLFHHYRTDEAIATLDKADGKVERDHAEALGRFEHAALGSRFRVGDGIKTAHAATATVRLDDGSKLVLEQDTLLRFLATSPEVKGRGLDVETGSAVFEAGASPLELYTSVGLALLEPGASVTIEKRGLGLRFSVEVGVARFETRDGSRSLEAGAAIDIDIGGAVIEKLPEPEPSEREPGEFQANGMIAAVIEGQGVRVRSPGAADWRMLSQGTAELMPGSSLELGSRARVTMTSGGGSVSLQGKGQFTLGVAGAPFVQATAGRLFVERGRTPISLAVPGGSIVVRPWSKVDAAVDARRAQLTVAAGSAEVLGALGRDDVRAGESATLLSSGRLEVSGRGPQRADMIAVAGTSFVVHDPNPPTSVGFRLKDLCATGGLVETLAATSSRVLASARGEDSANLLLARGSHRYQVRCVGQSGVARKPSASGFVTILRDSGTGVLSRVPPMTRIDLDGRSYTVTYQNLLPEIVVRWPKAPQASSYTLTLDSRSGVSTTEVSRPTLTFKAGQIKEGRHTLTFGANGRTSAPTRLAIVFDNAAPTARIQSPQNGSFQPGSAVTVTGVAVPGWGISVSGKELATDDQARFSEQVIASTDQQALQLCFTHPRRGVHYYLRHAAGAAL